METAATYLTKGDRLKRAGKLKEAIASYRQATEINPHFSWSHHKLGEALAKRGLLDEAIAAYGLAIELNPKSAWSYYELGEVFATKGEFDAAVPNYRRACELEPNFEGFSRGLEKALEKSGDRPQIPEKGRAFFEEAKTHFANRLWPETITSCRQAIEAGVEEFECYKILAWSYKKRQRWEEAIAAYLKLIEINPTDSQGYYLLGDIFRIQGKLEEQIAVYRKGLEKLPDDLELTARLQSLLAAQKQQQKTLEAEVSINPDASKYRTLAVSYKKSGNWQEAIAAYRKAIEIQARGFDYCELGMLLLQKQQWEEALFCYDKLLEMQPWVGREVKHFLSFGIALVRERKLPQVIDSYHKIFQKKIDNLEYYSQLSVRLSQAGLRSEAVALFREMPKPQQPQIKDNAELNGEAELSKYDAIWNWFNRPNAGEFNLDVNLDDLKNESDKISEHFQNKETQTFLLPNLTIKEKIFLQKLGISAEYVKLMKGENNALENIYLNAFHNDRLSDNFQRNQPHSHKNFQCWYRINTPVEFPHTIAEFQYMYAADPCSGEIVRSDESFFMGDSAIFYRFQGREIFYIIAGNFSGEKVVLYVPRLQIAIYYHPWERPNQKLYQNFQTLIVTYFKDVLEYISSTQKKVVTSVLGFINNLGHFFWQDLNGIYYAYKNNLLDKIESFAVGPYEKMELTSIMPEIPESKILKISETSESKIFQSFLKNNCFCLRMTENFIARECTERVYKAAIEKCSPDFLKMLTELKEKKEVFPLLWINVRGHNKSWISQEEGYANILNKLSENFPDIGIVVDGWVDCNDVVENIQKQLKPNVKVYNTLGCPLHESIVWGDRIDAYIAVVGSGLTITSWLNDKPGVAYANRGHIKQRNFWSKVKEKSIEPSFLDFSDIVEVGTGGWGNYEINWQVIYDRIFPILKNLSDN